ncbi:MAG TPA: hypothetical protein VHW60_13575 [Caulobacteraceae bacterium]|nr:hypothetical protein [Caulobacteraceae bacterium]
MLRQGLIGILLAAAVAPHAWAEPTFPKKPTAAEVSQSIVRYGARATVSALFDQKRWDYVAGRIGEGDAAWVALAPKLAPGADAGTAEELPIELAFALPLNPAAVLAAVHTGAFEVSDVCGAPFIEDTVKDIPGYLRKATAAVARVTDPALAATKAACLQTLAKAG